jgi:hypothetical protein
MDEHTIEYPTRSRRRSRRLRLWVCRCCGRCWKRKKIDERGPGGLVCVYCNLRTEAGRTYPHSRKCKHERAHEKVSKWKRSKWSVPRMQSGRKLSLTPEIRRAWREVRKAKTRPNLLRKTEMFIELLLAHAQDTVGPDGKVVRWQRSLKLSRDGKRVEESKVAGGGFSKLPISVTDSGPSNRYGIFRRGFSCGIGIEIHASRELHPDATSIRVTLVHEILHALDSLAGLRDSGHDLLWRSRLKRAYELFPPTPLMVRPTAEDIERWLH